MRFFHGSILTTKTLQTLKVFPTNQNAEICRNAMLKEDFSLQRRPLGSPQEER
jgi:hypothetical protein